MATHSIKALAIVDDTILTEVSDAVTVIQMYHTIAAETGTTDNLATITVGHTGLSGAGLTFRPIIIIKADAGDTITVKHGTGNIQLNGGIDIAITGNKHMLLIYDGTNWNDLL